MIRRVWPKSSGTIRATLAVSLLASTATSQDVAEARVTVEASRATGEISPMLYGQFVEFMYEGVKGGLSAELLRDRGFDEPPSAIGLPRYWERYPDDRNDDYGLSFRWDDSVAYPLAPAPAEFAADGSAAWGSHPDSQPAQRALRVITRAGVIPRHGVYQPRVPIRAGLTYRAYLWLRSAADSGRYHGRVTLALEQDAGGGAVYAEQSVRVAGDEWRKYEFQLRPTRSDPLARFVILFGGVGRLWVDQVSLLPSSAEGGIRADVAARVAALRPAFIRWPGGNVAQDYHWVWGVGPRDGRPVWTNLSWAGEREPGDVGTDEFISFARRVGAEPSLTVNVEGRGATPAEAAAWVEYCNGSPTSRYGALRAANGHPTPYRVKYWEIGNEIWGDWVRGHSDAESYARNFRRYREAMRAVDSGLAFIAVGDNDMNWNRTVLRRVGREIDFLAIHHYYGHDSAQRDARSLMARPLYFERFYRRVDSLARAEAPGHAVRLAINEWGLALPEAREHSMDAALYAARLMNVFERSSPLVGMTAVSDLVNGWPGGIIQADRSAVFVTPVYHVNALYASHLGRTRLDTRVTSPTFDSGSEGRNIPVLDVVASRSADGARVFLKLVNTDQGRAVETRIDLRGARVSGYAEWTMLAAEPAAHNSFATPNAVAPRRARLAVGPRFRVRLPPRSVSVLTLDVLARGR